MAANRVAALLDFLRESQILDRTQLEEISRSTTVRSDDPSSVAGELVQRKWLSSYQGKLLAQGRGKELQFGPYQLVDRIGEGGMGQVFKAYHPMTGRTVAL